MDEIGEFTKQVLKAIQEGLDGTGYKISGNIHIEHDSPKGKVSFDITNEY